MLKRSLSLLALFASMAPMAAFAGTLATRVSTVGGSLAVNGGAAQTSATGTVSKSYTGTASVVMTSTTPGYALAAVTLDGVPQTNLPSSLNLDMATNHTLSVSFAKYQVTVTSSATTPDGTVSPYGANKYYAATPLTYTFTPNKGKMVQSITVTGATASLDQTLPSAVPVKATFTPTGNVTVVGSFVALSASAGANQTVIMNGGAASASLAGTASAPTGTTYAWTQVGGPAASITTPDAASTGVTFTAAGTYSFKLTATNGTNVATSTTSVTVAATASDAALNSCVNCHNSYSPAVAPAVYPAWNDTASVHKANTVLCANCHVGADTGAHPGAQAACTNCHSAENGKFTGSIHWLSQTGRESDADFTAAGHGSVASCAAKCHFVQGATSSCAVCHSGALASGGTIAAKDLHSVNVVTGSNTCVYCHSGSKHGWSTDAFHKSSHYTGDHAKLYYQFDVKQCTNCHDAHSTVATMTDGLTDTCSKCHKGAYGLYNADGSPKAPHTLGKAAPVKGVNGATADGAVNVGDSTTMYLTQGAICQDCHAHDNTVNAGFAEGGHGAVSSDPLNPFTHYDWSTKSSAEGTGSRQNGNCNRCHTAQGFIRFAKADLTNDPATLTRLALQPNKPNNVLICTTCHMYLEGESKPILSSLRTGGTPNGNGQTLANGYFALFSSAASAVPAGKTQIQIAYPGMKNSSVCVPCHAGRSTAAVFSAVIDQAGAANKNYSTVSTSYYQHAKNIGQTFISQGAYDFTGKLAAITANGPSAHVAVKMGAADTAGPCAGCHHSTVGKTHSLEVDATSPTCINAGTCHASAPDLTVAKANFDAGVAALTNLIHAKMDGLRTTSADLSTERANVRFGRFGKADGVGADAATAKAAYGAWYNWQLLSIYDNAAWAHNPRYARQILNDTILYLAGNGVIPSSGSAQRTLIDSALTTYSADATAAAAAKSFYTAPGCGACHSANTNAFPASYHGNDLKYACANCHTELHMTTDLTAQPTCRCHGDNATAHPVKDAITAAGAVCASCHTTNDVHSIKGADSTRECLDCHAVEIKHPGTKVADNNGGVRAITGEFQKRSHHIINADGSAPTSAQCAVCHLEGKAVNGKVVADSTYHMKDNKIYLRNADTGAAFTWSGTEHTNMDNFCFSCHDADGAKAIDPALVALLPNGVSASNPFGDSLKNSYDQVTRAAVVDVKTAFTTSNASHHAVSGQRYKYRFSTVANAQAWATRTGNAMPSDDQIAENHVGEASPNGGVIEEFDAEEPMTGDFTLGSATPGEGDATLFEAGKFVATYTPLGASESVADNSTLHCGDCHTVGQWKNDNTAFNQAAIGAHGSNNEYLLRNNTGTDALHNNLTYVCFNCHVAGFKGNHPTTSKPQILGYATSHAVSAMHIQCLADSADNLGGADRLAKSWEADKVKAYDYKPAPGATATAPAGGSNAGSGNITGIACTNCHNSGLRSGWGGIHGGDNTYTDGLGRTQKTYRFMPGMGNYKYAPPGGWDGKDVSDSRFVTQAGNAAGIPGGKPMGGCYTNNTATENAGFSACSHHGTSTAGPGQGGYNGGTTTVGNGSGTNGGDDTPGTMKPDRNGVLSPTSSKENPAWEPTVREATAGNALVTRPLKY